MNKVLKYVGIGGLVVGVLASIALVGKPTTEEECNELEKQTEEHPAGQENKE